MGLKVHPGNAGWQFLKNFSQNPIAKPGKGCYNADVHKVRGKGPLSGKQYSVDDYAIMTAPNNFQRSEELIDWLRANQEKIILRYFRRCFSK